MADQNGSATLKENIAPANSSADSKGKGKAVEVQEASMDDSSSDEEVDEVRYTERLYFDFVY